MMPRFPMPWHRARLANHEYLLQEREKELAALQDNIDRLRARIVFSRAQIEEAVRRGVEGYDAERFMVKHPRHGTHTVVAVEVEGE